MSQFDAKTGSPPPRQRYRVSYRARPLDDPEGSWSFGDMEVISRSSEEAREFASQIGRDGVNEYEITGCEDMTPNTRLKGG